MSAMLKDENDDFLKSLKKKHRNNRDLKVVAESKDDKMSDDDSGNEDNDEPVLGDPVESQAAFKAYLLHTMVSNELDQKRASKMEILDFLTLLNCLNKAGIHFK